MKKILPYFSVLLRTPDKVHVLDNDRTLAAGRVFGLCGREVGDMHKAAIIKFPNRSVGAKLSADDLRGYRVESAAFQLDAFVGGILDEGIEVCGECRKLLATRFSVADDDDVGDGYLVGVPLPKGAKIGIRRLVSMHGVDEDSLRLDWMGEEYRLWKNDDVWFLAYWFEVFGSNGTEVQLGKLDDYLGLDER